LSVDARGEAREKNALFLLFYPNNEFSPFSICGNQILS